MIATGLTNEKRVTAPGRTHLRAFAGLRNAVKVFILMATRQLRLSRLPGALGLAPNGRVTRLRKSSRKFTKLIVFGVVGETTTPKTMILVNCRKS